MYILWKDSSAVIKHTVPRDTLRQLAPFSLFSTSSPILTGFPERGRLRADLRVGSPRRDSKHGLRARSQSWVPNGVFELGAQAGSASERAGFGGFRGYDVITGETRMTD